MLDHRTIWGGLVGLALAACGGAGGDGIEGLALSYGEAAAKAVLEGATDGPVGPMKRSDHPAQQSPEQLRAALGAGAKLTAVKVGVGEASYPKFWEADALVLPDRRVVFVAFRSRLVDAPDEAIPMVSYQVLDSAPKALTAHLDAVRARLVGACDLPLATAADAQAAGLPRAAIDIDPAKLTTDRAKACSVAKAFAGGTRHASFSPQLASAQSTLTVFLQLPSEPSLATEWSAYSVDQR